MNETVTALIRGAAIRLGQTFGSALAPPKARPQMIPASYPRQIAFSVLPGFSHAYASATGMTAEPGVTQDVSSMSSHSDCRAIADAAEIASTALLREPRNRARAFPSSLCKPAAKAVNKSAIRRSTRRVLPDLSSRNLAHKRSGEDALIAAKSGRPQTTAHRQRRR